METTDLIDWKSDGSHLLLNPRMPAQERVRLEGLVVDLPGHLWLATSGTSGAIKLAGLSKRAMLISAGAVNRRLQATAGDVWCCPLPLFHVGGLGIYARAYLSGAAVIALKWSPAEFAAIDQMTLASVVPTQLRDLVVAGLRAPGRIRAIVVGGGPLSEALYRDARALGWPVLPSYGMTECSSQVATAREGSTELEMLDHVVARGEGDGRIALRSEALFTGYATEDGLVDPRVDGWFVTDDQGTVSGRVLRIDGRTEDFVKIGGESVDLARLDRVLAEVMADGAVFAIPEERMGNAIVLALTKGNPEAVVAAFNERVLPFERAHRAVMVSSIPLGPLGKIARWRLLEAERQGGAGLPE